MSTRSHPTFSQRNVYYLRVSAYCVLQLILYIDASHLKWVNANPDVFQRSLAKLRNLIMPKLGREAGPDGKLGTISKKEKVEVHSEPDFHMCYFFRRMSQRHAVLLKEKNLVFPASNSTSNLEGNGVSVPMTIEDEDSLNPNQTGFFQQFENSQAANGPIPKRKKRRTNREGGVEGNPVGIGHDDDGWGGMNLGVNLGMGFSIDNHSAPQALQVGRNNSDQHETVSRENGVDLNELTGSGSGNGILVHDSDEEDEAQGNAPSEGDDSRSRNQDSHAEDKIVVKKEPVDDEDEISFQGYSNPEVGSANQELNQGGEPYMQETIMGPSDHDDLQEQQYVDDEEEKPKARLNVSYSGFRILEKSLVLVIEPSTRTKNAEKNLHLFNPAPVEEPRKLNVTPVIDASSSRKRGSRSQSRLSSIQPPSNRNSRNGREKSETPLFRGMTPSSEIDEDDEFGSVPPSSPGRSGRERSESLNLNASTSTNTGPEKGKKTFPPVPMFNDQRDPPSAEDLSGMDLDNDNRDEEDVAEELDEESRSKLEGFNFASQLLSGEEDWLGGSEENGGRGD